MYKFLLICMCFTFCAACTAKNEDQGISAASDEMIFSTSVKTPSDFDSWTFFWQMPQIDKDAQLGYSVIMPDGKECFNYVFPKRPKTGGNIRSDFTEKTYKGKMEDFENKVITIRIKVNKGVIKFVQKPDFRFVFRKTINAVHKYISKKEGQ